MLNSSTGQNTRPSLLTTQIICQAFGPKSPTEADEGDGAGGDGGTSFDLFGPDPTPMEDL